MAGTQPPVRVVSNGTSRDRQPPQRKPRHPRRWRYWRRHTPHFYLVLIAATCAVLACAATAAAYLNGGLVLGSTAAVMVGAAALAVCFAYFWGFFLLLSGQVPTNRFKFVVPHACVGTLSPLLFMLTFSLALDGMGKRPVSLWLVGLTAAGVLLLAVQATMGRAIVYRPRPHLVRAGPDEALRSPGRSRIVAALGRFRSRQ